MATVPKKEKRYTKSTKHTPLDKDNGNYPIGNLEVGHTINSIEDVFKTMGVWEKAVALHKKGLTWSQVAIELISDCER